MANPYFKFKQFTVFHDRCAMKVTTDACLFGAWCAEDIKEAKHNNQWAKEEPNSLLDIGTGSGLLSLMIAQKNTVSIDAVEIELEAALQAKQNIKESPYGERITVHHSDIMEWEKGNYDLIISNPPFYENEIPSTRQQKNIAHHSEGLRLEALFQVLSAKLTVTGTFYLLLPFKRKSAIDRLLEQTGLYLKQQIIVHPSASHLPFRLLLKGSKIKTETCIKTLSIYNEEKQYTPAFVSLLRDYYLYL